jgi:hypothetical protein
MMAAGERLRIMQVQKGRCQSAIARGNRAHACPLSRIESGYRDHGFETLEQMVSVETRYEWSFSCFVRVGWSKRAGSR